MAYIRPICVWCRKLSPLCHHNGDLLTCIICLENAKSTYSDNREIVLRRCKTYRDNNGETNQELHKLYKFSTNGDIIENKR